MCHPGSSWNPTAAEQHTPLQWAFVLQKRSFFPQDYASTCPQTNLWFPMHIFFIKKQVGVLVGFLGFEFVFSDFFWRCFLHSLTKPLKELNQALKSGKVCKDYGIPQGLVRT